MLVFDSELLDDASELLENPNEVSGWLVPDNDNKLVLIVDHEAISTATQTQASRMDRIIFHTHPITAKSYPSHQDVKKALKLRKDSNLVEYSIIFTARGIWILHSHKKIPIGDDFLKKQQMICDKMYFERIDDFWIAAQKFIYRTAKLARGYGGQIDISFVSWN